MKSDSGREREWEKKDWYFFGSGGDERKFLGDS